MLSVRFVELRAHLLRSLQRGVAKSLGHSVHASKTQQPLSVFFCETAGSHENVEREDNVDPHPYRVLSLGWSNHHDLHRGKSQRLQCLVMRSPFPWNMPVPLTTRHWRSNLCRCQRHSVPDKEAQETLFKLLEIL